ncbi:hypothetical protein ABY42_10460 [Haloferax gibbonsii]|uniref:Nitroreductase domain-containing protein n=1 Tax=Haloferax gibbonsii TaxID=35746 RepID=A0A0K1IV01_HALGI|nr:hypothetical protein ABY42_10460 [Haloferax gibbonsii]
MIWKILPKATTLRFISRSRILTTIYYLISGTFYREQRSVLCGLAKYHELEVEGESPHHQIIRSTHRIEKGLSMKERREVFAESYIQNLVTDLIGAWEDGLNDENMDRAQLEWTIDVLAKYFNVVKKTEPISEAETRYTNFLDQIEYTPGNRIPVPRRELGDISVSPEDMKELASRRTSTRWFEQKKVPRTKIDDALEIAMESPSACNRQSYEFRIYDDPNLIDNISSLAIGASGYKDNIPCLAVVVGKQRAYFNDRDKHVIYIDASLAAMAFQFGLETQGLASCCINWPAIPQNEERIEDLLNLECDENVVMLMAIGYPDSDGMVPHSEKKSVKSVRSYNKN